MELNLFEIDQADLDLEYVRGKRKLVIDELTAKGVPEDNKTLGTLLIALSDMDRASLGKKKIKLDKDIGSKNNQAIELIASIFGDSKVKKMGSGVGDKDTAIPELGPNIPEPELVDGETDQHITAENYDTFMERLAGKD